MNNNENFDDIVEMKLNDEDIMELFELDLSGSINIAAFKGSDCDASRTRQGGNKTCSCCY